MKEAIRSGFAFGVQLDYESTLLQAAHRFVDERQPALAVAMYATAVEHWVNGMLAVGLKRRGQELDHATERGTLAEKLAVRWCNLFGLEFPETLRGEMLQLAGTRNNFVHAVVFDGEWRRLEQILDDMELFDVSAQAE